MPLIKSLTVVPTPTAHVRSGLVTPFGVVLRVDRCAPEHGGGILAWFPLSRTGSHIEDGGHLHTFGYIDAEVLDALRSSSTAVTGIDYTGGIR